MKKSELLSEIKEHIGNTANEVKPQKTASSIYFVFKQNNINPNGAMTYISILKEVKMYLRDEFHWNWNEIHRCFCELNQLLR